jgi:hypothetical protein
LLKDGDEISAEPELSCADDVFKLDEDMTLRRGLICASVHIPYSEVSIADRSFHELVSNTTDSLYVLI